MDHPQFRHNLILLYIPIVREKMEELNTAVMKFMTRQPARELVIFHVLFRLILGKSVVVKILEMVFWNLNLPGIQVQVF